MTTGTVSPIRAVYLWATNTKKLVVTPGGVGKYIPAQQIRCDSCGGEYTLTDRKLKHKSSEICKCCGKKMNVRGTQYSSKRLCAKRTFVWNKKQGTGVWLRKYAVYFGFANHKAKMNIYAEGIWWTDGKEILRWEKRWQNNYAEQKYVMCQNSRLSAALLAPGGYSLSLLYGKPLGGSNIRCHFAGKWLKYILAFTGRQSTLVRRYQCYV